MTSQTICEANVSFWNGGKPPPCSLAGTCSVEVIVFLFCAMIKPGGAAHGRPGYWPPNLEREQEQQRDQQREDSHRLGHREPEDQVAEAMGIFSLLIAL